MPINTRRVAGRRDVRYESFDDLLADAERVTSSPRRTLGNWTVAQILGHVAVSLNQSIDGLDMPVPAPVRWIARLLFKRRFLTRPQLPGFIFPERLKPLLEVPADTTPDAALQQLRHAIQRVQREPHRAPNVLLGQLTRAETDAFHLRHAEMHMSFIVE